MAACEPSAFGECRARQHEYRKHEGNGEDELEESLTCVRRRSESRALAKELLAAEEQPELRENECGEQHDERGERRRDVEGAEGEGQGIGQRLDSAVDAQCTADPARHKPRVE